MKHVLILPTLSTTHISHALTALATPFALTDARPTVIGHQLGPHGVPHGKTSCICLAPVLRYETSHPDSPHWDVDAHHAILKVFNEVLDWTENTAADAVERFVKDVGMPTKLSEVGITDEEALKEIAEHTMSDIWGGGESQLENQGRVLEILGMVR